MTSQHLKKKYLEHKEKTLFGRYITNGMITPLIKKLGKRISSSIIGNSVENRPIYLLKVGTGKTKVLLWSQMHGNESTTTKALFDLFNVLESNTLNDILEHCTLCIVPILNPDGAEYYTRVNANKVDLNRDAKHLSQPESKILREVFNNFQPHFCFNLHGQRTIFGVGYTGVSSTLSFLAPSVNDERSVNNIRKSAMSIIACICNSLKEDLPNGIARYNDGFNINCVGDSFQTFGTPTILFEAGHYPNDYDREEVRFLMFKSIVYGLKAISEGISISPYQQYFDIPENQKNFYDIIIKNVKLKTDTNEALDIAIQYKECLNKGKVHFVPIVKKIEKLPDYYGHKIFDAKAQYIYFNSELSVGNEIDFFLLNNEKTVLFP